MRINITPPHTHTSQVFNAFNDTVDFQLTPAVRTTTGACIEESNCDWELATVCAFDQTNTAGQVSFLACMDDRAGTAKSASKYCANKCGLDDGKLTTCYGGQHGQDLLANASKVWNHFFPSRATVPHTLVGTSTVQADYGDLKTALCQAGAKADVCNGVRLASTSCSI